MGAYVYNFLLEYYELFVLWEAGLLYKTQINKMSKNKACSLITQTGVQHCYHVVTRQ